jgi:hypothetical protein
MSHGWLHDNLHISDSDILTLKDSHLYQFRFLDTSTDASPPHHKFVEDIYISEFKASPHRFIQIGTLFGSSRLRLKNPANAGIRQAIRQSMTFTNPLFLAIVSSIKEFFSQRYIGAHLRLGDGHFKTNSAENIRDVWRRLVQQMLNGTVESTLGLERMIWETPGSLPRWRMPATGETCHYDSDCCRGYLHTDPSLAIFNLPLFVSTDIVDPEAHPDLEGLLRTFPCTYFLHDFAHQTRRLDSLKSGVDGLRLKKYVLPFIDAMVAGHADAFVGTNGSTYSGFIEDVLWPTYHGQEIRQRG